VCRRALSHTDEAAVRKTRGFFNPAVGQQDELGGSSWLFTFTQLTLNSVCKTERQREKEKPFLKCQVRLIVITAAVCYLHLNGRIVELLKRRYVSEDHRLGEIQVMVVTMMMIATNIQWSKTCLVIQIFSQPQKKFPSFMNLNIMTIFTKTRQWPITPAKRNQYTKSHGILIPF
jgi:hypothetical protein